MPSCPHPQKTEVQEKSQDNPASSKEQKDPYPEPARADTGEVRVPWVHPGIDIVPDKPPTTPGTDHAELITPVTAFRAPEGEFRAHNGAPVE